LQTTATFPRIQSLDIYRGAAVAGMILVDNPGSDELAYGPIKHTVWNGWTPADLIFPSFLFIVGVSLVFSISARLARGESTHESVPAVLPPDLVERVEFDPPAVDQLLREVDEAVVVRRRFKIL
jgi:uncharacterized membrane protein